MVGTGDLRAVGVLVRPLPESGRHDADVALDRRDRSGILAVGGEDPDASTDDDDRHQPHRRPPEPASPDEAVSLVDHRSRVEVRVCRGRVVGGRAQHGAEPVLELGVHRWPPSLVASCVRRAARPRDAADFTVPTEMPSRSAVAASERSW